MTVTPSGPVDALTAARIYNTALAAPQQDAGAEWGHVRWRASRWPDTVRANLMPLGTNPFPDNDTVTRDEVTAPWAAVTLALGAGADAWAEQYADMMSMLLPVTYLPAPGSDGFNHHDGRRVVIDTVHDTPRDPTCENLHLLVVNLTGMWENYPGRDTHVQAEITRLLGTAADDIPVTGLRMLYVADTARSIPPRVLDAVGAVMVFDINHPDSITGLDWVTPDTIPSSSRWSEFPGGLEVPPDVTRCWVTRKSVDAPGWAVMDAYKL